MTFTSTIHANTLESLKRKVGELIDRETFNPDVEVAKCRFGFDGDMRVAEITFADMSEGEWL